MKAQEKGKMKSRDTSLAASRKTPSPTPPNRRTAEAGSSGAEALHGAPTCHDRWPPANRSGAQHGRVARLIEQESLIAGCGIKASSPPRYYRLIKVILNYVFCPLLCRHVLPDFSFW
uniref:Uncharacterized protein n=1 Tax=Oryza barthii TaxID=65489 RepID=A0A0D3G654_9ORYZ